MKVHELNELANRSYEGLTNWFTNWFLDLEIHQILIVLLILIFFCISVFAEHRKNN